MSVTSVWASRSEKPRQICDSRGGSFVTESEVVIKRISVDSSSIHSIGYDADSLTLEIKFHSGALYQYQNVPQPEWDALMNAKSKGTYLNSNIKDQYPYVKL